MQKETALPTFAGLGRLGRPVAYHPTIAIAFGSVNACLFLCQFMYWEGKQDDPDGWIFKTQSDITEETGLSRREQDTARKVLKDLGVLTEKLQGVPPIVHYKFNWGKADEVLSNSMNTPIAPKRQTNLPGVSIAPKRQIDLAENAKLNAQKRQIELHQNAKSLSENTSETTSKTTIEGVGDEKSPTPPPILKKSKMPDPTSPNAGKANNFHRGAAEWAARPQTPPEGTILNLATINMEQAIRRCLSAYGSEKVTNETVRACTELAQSQFIHLIPADIETAFQFAVSGKLPTRLVAYGNSISTAQFGAVLTEYAALRKSKPAPILLQHDQITPEAIAEAIRVKNLEVAKVAVDAKRRGDKFEFDDMPHWWFEPLEIAGEIQLDFAEKNRIKAVAVEKLQLDPENPAHLPEIKIMARRLAVQAWLA